MRGAAGIALLIFAGPAAAVASSSVDLAVDGKSEWVISSPSRERPGVEWAIGEIARYVERMSGCRLPVGEPPAGGPRVLVGLRGDLAAGDRAALAEPAAGHDGYSLSVIPAEGARPARVIIAGENGRGVIYGAYDFLERMGCRWPYPALDPEDPEVVPRRERLPLDPVRLSVASPLRFRIANGSAWFFDMDLRAAALQLDWAMKNRYNAMGWQCDHRSPATSQYRRMVDAGLMDELARRDMVLHGPGHSFDQFLRADDHLNNHPEWFGLRDGKRVPQSFLGAQFCWSNPEARGEFARNVEAFVAQCPRIKILCIVPFDGGKACACAECERGGAANLLLQLLHQVIERLAKSAPEVLVETVGGYGPSTEPPSLTAIDQRQRMIWAHWGRYHKSGYDDPAYDRRANLAAWRKAAPGGLTICQYYTDNFCQPWILPPFAGAVVSDRRYFIANRIESAYVLMWPKGYWWNHGLNGVLAGRCFYDPALDPREAIRDHALHYFGDQAGPLLAAYLDEWARDVDLAYRVRDGASDADRAALAAQRTKWIDPAVSTVKDDPVLSRRVGKLEKLHALAESLADLHRLREEARVSGKDADRSRARRLLALARERTAEVLARMRALADLEQGLIDRNEVSGFIALGLNGRLEELEKILSAP